jgi:hypothetical protein
MEKKTESPAMERLSASTGLDIAHPLRNADAGRRGATPLSAMDRNAIAMLVPNCASARGRRRRTSAR